MTDETLFDAESETSIADVAALFSRLGDGLRDDGEIALTQDGETTTIDVPDTLSVSVDVEREDGDTEVEVELEWAGDTATQESVPEAPGAEAVGDEFAVGAPDVPWSSLGRFEVYQDTADEWRWRLVHRNGNIIATGGEGYASRQNAEKGLRSVMQNAPGAVVSRAE